MGQGAGARWVQDQAREGQSGWEQGTLSTSAPRARPLLQMTDRALSSWPSSPGITPVAGG